MVNWKPLEFDQTPRFLVTTIRMLKSLTDEAKLTSQVYRLKMDVILLTSMYLDEPFNPDVVFIPYKHA